MTTYWDPKAARTAAAADAQARLAEAEATRAETALRLEQTRMQMDAERERTASQAREERRQAKAKAKETRRTERAKRGAARRAALGEAAVATAEAISARVPLLVGAIAMGAPIAIAWDGQLEFGTQVMQLGALAAAVPVALEGSAWYLAWLTHKALEAERPTARLRVWTWLLALTAAAMNVWHGATGTAFGADGLQVGLVRGLASLLGVGLWELTVMARRQRTSGRPLAELRTALWRRVRYPRLSWAAASIQAARGSQCSAELAWRAAWIDRYGVGPDASGRERRLSRRAMRRQARADRKAVRKGQAAMVGGLVIGRPIPIVMPSVDRSTLPLPAASIDQVEAHVDRSTPGLVEAPSGESASTRRSIEAPAAEALPRSIEGPAQPVSAPIDSPVLAVGRHTPVDRPAGRSGRSGRAARRQIEAPGARRSIDGHRAALAAAIEAGSIDARPTAEAIRKTLRCAPSIARRLRDELAEGVAA